MVCLRELFVYGRHEKREVHIFRSFDVKRQVVVGGVDVPLVDGHRLGRGMTCAAIKMGFGIGH